MVIFLHAIQDGEGNVDAECSVEPIMSDTASLPEVNDNEVSSFLLGHCLRIVPHDKNTGAFFIVVFHKRSRFPGRSEYQTRSYLALNVAFV